MLRSRSSKRPFRAGITTLVMSLLLVAVIVGIEGLRHPAGQPLAEQPGTPKPGQGFNSAGSTDAADGTGVGAVLGRGGSGRGAHRTGRHTAGTAVARIGTWNVEWLGKPYERSGLGQGTPQSPADIAEYIRFSGVDVLALQEVAPQAAAGAISTGSARRRTGEPAARRAEQAPRSPELDATVEVLSHGGGAWRYVLFPGRRAGDQLCGVLWNASVATAVDEAGQPFSVGQERASKVPVKPGKSATGSNLWNRPPHAMKFSFGLGKTDVVLVVLHMKANYQGDFSIQRQQEAQSLAGAIDAVRSSMSDQDIVLLGDTNFTSGSEPAEATLVAAGFVDLNARGRTTQYRGGSMDRIFAPVGQPEFAGSTFEVMDEGWLDSKRWKPSDFKTRLSDHYMVVASVAVLEDDD